MKIIAVSILCLGIITGECRAQSASESRQIISAVPATDKITTEHHHEGIVPATVARDGTSLNVPTALASDFRHARPANGAAIQAAHHPSPAEKALHDAPAGATLLVVSELHRDGKPHIAGNSILTASNPK